MRFEILTIFLIYAAIHCNSIYLQHIQGGEKCHKVYIMRIESPEHFENTIRR